MPQRAAATGHAVSGPSMRNTDIILHNTRGKIAGEFTTANMLCFGTLKIIPRCKMQKGNNCAVMLSENGDGELHYGLLNSKSDNGNKRNVRFLVP